jgi:hypothetical protein
MLRRLVLAAIAIAAAGTMTIADAQQNRDDQWVRIATEEIDPAIGNDTIDLTKAKGKFKAFRLQIKKQGLEVTRVQVKYADGAVHNEDRLIKLKTGDRSRPIDLKSEERFVDSLQVVYKPAPEAKRKPSMEVWGLQSPAGRKAERPVGPVTGQVAGTPTNPTPDMSAPGTVSDAKDVMFGYNNVGFGLDHDVIRVGSETGKFEHIRLRVLENDIFIKELTVAYVDGQKQNLAVNAEVKANTRTDWLAVDGSKFIKEIALLYRSKPNLKGQARVEVSGQYAAGWLGPKGEGRKYNQGWVLLGAQTAGTWGYDNDVIPVGTNEGGFSKLRVKVRDRSITLVQLRVVYYNGPDQLIKVGGRVDPDQIEGPFELQGDHPPIKEINAKYRTRMFFGKGKGSAVVEIWGQH